MPLYRYRIVTSGVLDEQLQRLTPSTFNVFAIHGSTVVDISAAAGEKDDLDAAMEKLGLAEVFLTDPTDQSGVNVQAIKDAMTNSIARWNDPTSLNDSLTNINDAGDLAISGVYKIGDNVLVIDDLGDVDTTTSTPVLEDSLVFDGTDWIPSGISAGGGDNHNLLSDTHPDTQVGAPTDGDLIFASGTTWTRLPRGSDDQVLTLVSSKPSWEDAAGGGGSGVFGTEFQEAVSEGVTSQTTASQAYAEKLSMTTTSLPSGDYHVIWQANLQTDNKAYKVRLQLDNTTDLNEHSSKVKTKDSPEGETVVGISTPTLSGVHTLDIDYGLGTDPTSSTISIQRARIQLWRVT